MRNWVQNMNFGAAASRLSAAICCFQELRRSTKTPLRDEGARTAFRPARNSSGIAARRNIISVSLLSAILALATTFTHGQNQSPISSGTSEAAVINKTLSKNRPGDADILILRGGEKLFGSIQNDSFSIRTAYATLKFDRRHLAGIELENGPQRLASIVTFNHNRFSGFLDSPAFVFKLESGPQLEVRREKVLKAIFQAPEKELAAIPRRQFILLKNGDFFTGKFLLDPFQLKTATGAIEIRSAELDSIKFSSENSPFVKVTARDGKVREGTLTAEDVDIELDLGPKIRIYQEWIDVIYGREGYVPESLAATASPAAAASNVPGPTGPPRAGKPMEGMVWIPPGEFVMGSPTSELERDLDEGPQTKITITHGFWMGKCEVTQGEYETVLGTNPSQFTGDARRPVEKVNWYDALKYCARLTQLHESAGKLPSGYVYRLPTEAEWEYASRAGTTTRFSYGSDPIYLRVGDYAWFNGNSGSSTHPVGTKQPNAWGLFDMHGNVLEWCLDTWVGSLPGGSAIDRPSSATGSLRVARGGSWLYEARYSRSANRDDYSPSNQCSDLGFRVVLAPGQP